jgi:hypothetical protein
VKLSDKPIEFLVGLITGDSGISEYRTGPKLVDFFNAHGETDLYGSGFPSRHIYVREKLNEINGQDRIVGIVEAAFNYLDDDEEHAENVAFQFSKIVSRDGLKLEKNYHPGFFSGSDYVSGPIFFKLVSVVRPVARLPKNVLLSHPCLLERVEKAKARIEAADYDGAIAICYTIVEQFLKLSLGRRRIPFKDTEGDIKKLYKALAHSSNLDPSSDAEASLKPLLSGLSTLVTGFYEVANKASDRHAGKYVPAKRHAVLVVNLTFAFCEFLVDSFEYQDFNKE